MRGRHKRGTLEVSSYNKSTTECLLRSHDMIQMILGKDAAFCVLRAALLRAACCVLRAACCVLRVACCVLRVACCVLRVACCVLRVARAPGYMCVQHHPLTIEYLLCHSHIELLGGCTFQKKIRI